MARPRLLFVVNADWFFVSHRLDLARTCIEAGYEVHLCAGESDARARIESAGIRFHPLPIDRGGTNPIRDAGTLRALDRVYRRVKPDVVHHVTIKPVIYGGILARLKGIPSVHSVSGLGYMFIENGGDSRAKSLLRMAIERLYSFVFASERSRVIFENPTDRDQFVELGLLPPSRARIVHGSGVDTTRFVPSPLPSEEAPVLLLPARILYDKGVGEFVEAARNLKRRHPTWRFVVAGRIDPGNPAAVSESTVRDWVAEGAIEWWAGLGPAEMPATFAKSTLVVLPSYREGLPLAVAEAAASGRAVVTTDVPGCRDAVIPDETGWLVPARDARALAETIELAFSSREELVRRGQRAILFARERFTRESICDATLSIYSELGVIPAAP